MTCPTCNDANHVEVDTHADGFARNLQECGLCGTLWTTSGEEVLVLHGATRRHGANTNECPICHCIDRVEIDIHADGFASTLEECGVCGALWTQEKNAVRLVHGATWAA